jgi:hypothetical protein
MARPRERRKQERLHVAEYLQFVNDETGQLVGALADISPGGFRLESGREIPVGSEYPFRIHVPPEVPTKPFVTFTARNRWTRRHPIDRSIYESGFEIVTMEAEDRGAFAVIEGRFGTNGGPRPAAPDYLWGNSP